MRESLEEAFSPHLPPIFFLIFASLWVGDTRVFSGVFIFSKSVIYYLFEIQRIQREKNQTNQQNELLLPTLHSSYAREGQPWLGKR